MKKSRHVLFLTIILLLFAACSSNGGDSSEKATAEKEEPIELFVSAAASLTNALEEMKEIYEKENNVELIFNFAGSGKLAQQIQQGAPVDIFISANENWMDTLIEEDFIVANTRVDVTGNKLVLITNEESTIDYASFEEINAEDLDEIAMGNPESVPAGEYTKAVLTAINKWNEMEDNIVFAQDVRQVLTYVETGNAEIGFVYESDALSSKRIRTLAESDTTMHDAIIYPGALTEDSQYQKEGKAFLEFMLSSQGQEILEDNGFTK